MLSESVIHYKRGMNMRHSILGWAVLAVLVTGLILLAGLALIYTPPPHHPHASRLVAHGLFVDVQQGKIFAKDFMVGWEAGYTEVEMQWEDSNGQDWEHELPITCEDLEVRIVRLRKTNDPSMTVITHVVIEDNNDVCGEVSP
jgi:hypothetical protein